MHEYGSAGVGGEGGGHGGVPGEAADIVDDFGSGVEGAAGDGGFIGVDGEDGVGALPPDGLDDGQNAVDLLLGGDGSGERGSLGGGGGGAGTGGFAADIENVGAFVEQRDGMGDGGLGIEKRPPSEKESGVTLSTPMMRVRSPSGSERWPMFHWKRGRMENAIVAGWGALG